ncbi:DUF3052 family protein [Streptomyces sp. MMG1121]
MPRQLPIPPGGCARDLQEAAQTADLSPTKSVSVAKDWSGAKMAAPKR